MTNTTRLEIGDRLPTMDSDFVVHIRNGLFLRGLTLAWVAGGWQVTCAPGLWAVRARQGVR